MNLCLLLGDTGALALAKIAPALRRAFRSLRVEPFILTPEKGARTSVYLASSPEVAGVTGEYFVKCKPRTPSRAARDEAAAARLWSVSEELVDGATS